MSDRNSNETDWIEKATTPKICDAAFPAWALICITALITTSVIFLILRVRKWMRSFCQRRLNQDPNSSSALEEGVLKWYQYKGPYCGTASQDGVSRGSTGEIRQDGRKIYKAVQSTSSLDQSPSSTCSLQKNWLQNPCASNVEPGGSSDKWQSIEGGYNILLIKEGLLKKISICYPQSKREWVEDTLIPKLQGKLRPHYFTEGKHNPPEIESELFSIGSCPISKLQKILEKSRKIILVFCELRILDNRWLYVIRQSYHAKPNDIIPIALQPCSRKEVNELSNESINCLANMNILFLQEQESNSEFWKELIKRYLVDSEEIRCKRSFRNFGHPEEVKKRKQSARYEHKYKIMLLKVAEDQVFIYYHPLKRKWVREILIPKLAQDQPEIIVKTDDDIPIGNVALDYIQKLIEDSGKVILTLCDSYIRDNMCIYITEQTYYVKKCDTIPLGLPPLALYAIRSTEPFKSLLSNEQVIFWTEKGSNEAFWVELRARIEGRVNH